MILPALQSAALRLTGNRPATFFGAPASAKLEAELCDFANEVAVDVAKYQDWQALVRTATITGVAGQALFDLPADYDRQTKDAAIQDATSWAWGFQRFTDINAFMQTERRGFSPYPGGWTIYSGKLRFAPAPAAGKTAIFPYITKNWATSATGTAKAAFTADTDSFVLPERLLTLGLVWRWRENKKLDSSGDMEAFTKALDEYAGKDGGARVIRSNGRRGFPGTRLAWPWALGPA